MRSSFSYDSLSDLKGREVQSLDGEKIGTVNDIFYDDTTREAEWIGLGTGFLGLKEAVVPVKDATFEGDCVVVHYAKDIIKKEPPVDEKDGVLTPESERELCEYFGTGRPSATTRRLNRYDFDI